MNDQSFTIHLPEQLISSHFKCFGHFITDHLFMLFKMKHYLNEHHMVNITTLNIIGNKDKVRPFMLSLYSVLFDSIIFNENIDTKYDLRVVLGSIKNTEIKKIYLALSDYNKNIPSFLYENARKVSEHNTYYALKFRDIIHSHFNVQSLIKKHILIVQRKSNTLNSNCRQWENIHLLTDQLDKKEISYDILSLEDYDIKDQIRLVNSYKYIITASNSSFLGHYFWTNKDTCIIECCITGMRCINTISYAKNLGIDLTLIPTKLNYNVSLNDQLPTRLRDILMYQYRNNTPINSNNIKVYDKKYQDEIEFYENCLHYPRYYSRIYRTNIDMNDNVQQILDIVLN